MDYNHLLRNMDYCELLTLTERWLWLMLVSGKCMGIASRQVYPQWHPAGREVLQGKHFDCANKSNYACVAFIMKWMTSLYSNIIWRNVFFSVFTLNYTS